MNESNTKILIVEDEFLTAKFFELKLKSFGFDVLKIVTNGNDAINSVIQLKPDFILMDIRLEGNIDGIDAAKEIMKHTNTKIIFVSGYSESNFIERLKEINYLKFFNKPLDFNKLIDLLNKNIPQK